MFRGVFRIVSACFCAAVLLFAVGFSASATETVPMAENISGKALVEKQKGFSSVNMLFDGRTKEYLRFRDKTEMTLAHEGGIGSLYLIFDVEYGEYTITEPETGKSYTAGRENFLHEYIDLEAFFGKAPTRVVLSFENGEGKLNEIYAFTSGQVPSFVQQWRKPAEGAADIVLFSTHGDDEQLFFAGLLPYYAAERDCQVQVVYMTGHRNMSMRRSHEMLDGLWAVGVKTYPVFGPFGDYNSSSKSEAYYRYQQKGISEEDILSFVVEQLRRFRPKAAIGHDLDGEYGHGMHMVYAENLCKAAEVSADPDSFPESAEAYGVWDVPKTYLHLYPENPVVMDWDQPLDSFDGMTAYEVTKKLGFPCHVSQQTYYSWYFSGKKTAAEVELYSPRKFGLYRSTVGEDVLKNDFLENVTTHGEDALLEQQRQEEAARREAEEAARLEAEKIRLEQEAARLEAEAEAARQQAVEALAAQQMQQSRDRYNRMVLYLSMGILLLILVMVLIFAQRKRKKKNFENF